MCRHGLVQVRASYIASKPRLYMSEFVRCLHVNCQCACEGRVEEATGPSKGLRRRLGPWPAKPLLLTHPYLTVGFNTRKPLLTYLHLVTFLHVIELRHCTLSRACEAISYLQRITPDPKLDDLGHSPSQ